VFHAPVGSFRPNAFGLHDVHGNAYEWVHDGFLFDAYAGRASVHDPFVAPESAHDRVGRGGDYEGNAALARSAERGGGAPEYRSPRMGLRPARSIER
jgi:formylglycine-generating enzyme required for sulfatase activity